MYPGPNNLNPYLHLALNEQGPKCPVTEMTRKQNYLVEVTRLSSINLIKLLICISLQAGAAMIGLVYTEVPLL